MAGEWVSATVGDAFELATGYAFKSSDFVEQGIPVIKIKNVKAGEFSDHDFSYVSEIFLRDRGDKLARSGDLLISMSGNRHDGSPETWVGKIAQFRKSGNYFINQRVGALRAKQGAQIDARFASYLLSSISYQELFIAIATSSGGQANLSPAQILTAPIRYPDLDTQRAIAHILGTLDDKIELNRRRSETLEAMARALFKSWFVDFDPVRAKSEGRDPGLPKPLADLFPARLVDSELGEIPEGWEVKPVGDHMVNFDSKRVPVSGAERSKRQGTYPYHGAAGVLDYVDDYLFDGIYLLVGEDGSVVQSNELAVTQYVWGKIWVNNHAHVLQGRGAVSTEQLYLYFHFEPVAPYVTGAVQPKLSQGRMNTMPFVFAGEDLCRAFERAIQPWFTKLRASVGETKTLAVVRDALLPKLISGELRVKDAERFIGRTA